MFAILLTDGYDFYLFDDFLKATEYRLPFKFKSSNNPRPTLKVINQEFIHKRPIYFKLKEIDYFQLHKPVELDLKEKENYGFEYRRYTYTPVKEELSNYCLLVLEDGSSFKLDCEVVALLRRRANKKERV